MPPLETGTLHDGPFSASGEAGNGPLSDPAAWDLEWQVLESDLAGRVPHREIQRLKRLDRQARRRGERVLHVPTYYAWGIA